MNKFDDHFEELGELFDEADETCCGFECDEDLINERFNEKIWEKLDDALHEPLFFKTFQEKLYDKLIADHAEDLSFCQLKPYLLELIQEKL